MGPIVRTAAGCTAGPSMLAHSSPVNSCARSHVPPLPHTTVNLPELIQLWALIFFSCCQKAESESLPKRAWGRLTAGYNNIGRWPTLGSGFPVMVLSRSWRCSQLPWEYHPGLSSDGSPSLSSSSLTGGEDRESDTTVWPNSQLLYDRTASLNPVS